MPKFLNFSLNHFKANLRIHWIQTLKIFQVELPNKLLFKRLLRKEIKKKKPE